MRMPFRSAIVITGWLAVTCLAGENRIWTDYRGRQLEASLIEAGSDAVVIKRSDGVRLKIPLERLSAADQTYARSKIPAPPAVDPPAAAEPPVASVPPAVAIVPETVFEDLSDPAWISLERGAVWNLISPGEIHQTDPDEPWKNNGYYRLLDQAGVMTYEFEVQVPGEKGGAGMFLMGQNHQAVEHGDSYLAYFSAGTEVTGGRGALCIAKFINDKPVSSWSPKFPLPARPGQWVALKIRFDPDSGEFVVWHDQQEIGRIRDPNPIVKGRHVVLHSFGTAARFRRIRFNQGG